MGWSLTVPEAGGISIGVEVPFETLTWNRAQQAGEFTVIGRQRPVRVLGERSGLKGTLPVVCRTAAAYADLQYVLNMRLTMLLTAPTGETWWVSAGDAPETWAPLVTTDGAVIRTVKVALTEVDPPPDGEL